MNGFPNLAGRPNIDDICAAELEAAGIEAVRFEIFRDQNPEVKTAVRGQLPPWRFSRNWRYWVARGPGIPPCYAAILHEKLGKEVRVEGHCGCPSPLEWHKGFAVGLYHVDTPEGLTMLADTIKLVMVEAERRHDLEKELREARAEVERLKRIVDTADGKDAESFDWSVLGEIDRLETENERLQVDYDGMSAALSDQHMEIDRLRAALEEIKDQASDYGDLENIRLVAARALNPERSEAND